MHQKKKDLQKRYEGFLQTKTLWKNNLVFGLQQFKLKSKLQKINFDINDKQRLGKYIEQFVFYELQSENIKILSKNVQIQREKKTLGELDCIILKDKTLIHLELIYKFYLYDATVGNSEIEHFIGPNRKDSLIEKLSKLKEKQLPLLYSEECKTYLSKLNIDTSKVKQQVYFKAQLFLPYSNKDVGLTFLNRKCVVGYYINKIELSKFKNCKFYIPVKKDWLVIPHKQVDWISFSKFCSNISIILERKFSPLFWLKKPNGELEKFFLVWW